MLRVSPSSTVYSTVPGGLCWPPNAAERGEGEGAGGRKGRGRGKEGEGQGGGRGRGRGKEGEGQGKEGEGGRGTERKEGRRWLENIEGRVGGAEEVDRERGQRMTKCEKL